MLSTHNVRVKTILKTCIDFCNSYIEITLQNLLLTGLNKNYLKFNGILYNIIYGLPIDSPLSPFLADPSRDHFEDILFKLNNTLITT